MAIPLVSVVVSAYNRPTMLHAAIESLQRQSYENLEILIQDDSTDDDCREVVEKLSDTRISYARNRPSLGTSLNLLAGYRKSQGKYFCTLNDDDLYGPNYIQTMVDALEGDSSCSLAFCDSYLINEVGEVKEKETEENSRASCRDRLTEGKIDNSIEVGLLWKSVPGMLAVFRREMVDVNFFPPQVSSGYDYWLTYLAVRDDNPIYYTPERLTYYRVHDGSQTASFLDPQERLRFLSYSRSIHEMFLEDPRLNAIYPTLYSRLAQIHASAGFSWLRLANRSAALDEFLRSSRTKQSVKAALGMLLSTLPASTVRVAFRLLQ